MTSVAADRIWAPWSHHQVESLNAYQKSGTVHPFTCPSGSHVLEARPLGWVCLDDEYRQGWAYRWMTDWSWREMSPFDQPRKFLVRTPTGTLIPMNAGELAAWSEWNESFQVETLRL